MGTYGSLPAVVTLQRIVSRKRGDKTYYKWQVTLPQEDVEALGWPAGAELETVIKGGALTLRKLK